MTLDKWFQIIKEEKTKSYEKTLGCNEPQSWHLCRSAMLEYIAEIDKAAEVYMLENSKEKQNGRT
jgi:hypothetical protein